MSASTGALALALDSPDIGVVGWDGPVASGVLSLALTRRGLFRASSFSAPLLFEASGSSARLRGVAAGSPGALASRSRCDTDRSGREGASGGLEAGTGSQVPLVSVSGGRVALAGAGGRKPPQPTRMSENAPIRRAWEMTAPKAPWIRRVAG